MNGRSDIKQTQYRRCEFCTKSFARKRWTSGALEDLSSYQKRRFCSLRCANSRPKGGLSRKAFHARARKQRKTNCEACGTTKRLHVHHVNEDWRNNESVNLQTLCTFCHQFWHALHARLGLKCMKPMPNLDSHLGAGLPPEWDDCGVTAMESLSKRRKPSSKAIGA